MAGREAAPARAATRSSRQRRASRPAGGASRAAHEQAKCKAMASHTSASPAVSGRCRRCARCAASCGRGRAQVQAAVWAGGRGAEGSSAAGSAQRGWRRVQRGWQRRRRTVASVMSDSVSASDHSLRSARDFLDGSTTAGAGQGRQVRRLRGRKKAAGGRPALGRGPPRQRRRQCGAHPSARARRPRPAPPASPAASTFCVSRFGCARVGARGGSRGGGMGGAPRVSAPAPRGDRTTPTGVSLTSLRRTLVPPARGPCPCSPAHVREK